MPKKPGLEDAAGQGLFADGGLLSSTVGEVVEVEPGYLGHRKRMRIKLLGSGPDSLADYELLEMVLFNAMPRVDTKPLAKRLLERFSSFAGVICATREELLRIDGLAEGGVAALKVVQAAAVRLTRPEYRQRPKLSDWDKLMDYLHARLSREKIEQFLILFLDNRNTLLADEIQASGTVNHAPVYPREVVRRALELQATALILVHNHPSGDPTPSRADIDMTREVKQAAATMGIVVHDHVIVGNGTWTSLRQQGLL